MMRDEDIQDISGAKHFHLSVVAINYVAKS